MILERNDKLAQLRLLQDDVAELTIQLEAREKEANGLDVEIREFDARFRYDQDAFRRSTDILTLEARLRELRADSDHLAGDIKILRDDITVLQGQLRDAEARNSRIELDIQEIEVRSDDLYKINTEYTLELDAAEQQHIKDRVEHQILVEEEVRAENVRRSLRWRDLYDTYHTKTYVTSYVPYTAPCYSATYYSADRTSSPCCRHHY